MCVYIHIFVHVFYVYNLPIYIYNPFSWEVEKISTKPNHAREQKKATSDLGSSRWFEERLFRKKEWWPLLEVSKPLFNKKQLFRGAKKIEFLKLYRTHPVEDETRTLQKMEIKRTQNPVFSPPNHLRSRSCQQGPKDMVDPFVLGMAAS